MLHAVTFAGRSFAPGQVRAAFDMLRYYRAFLGSDRLHCWSPEQPRWLRVFYTKDQAAARLAWLVNVGINRKASIPDEPSRKHSAAYQVAQDRDCRAVRDAVNRRIIVRQFETSEIRRRFGHLLHTD